jgi:NADPH-ferrihemoprotein reductase
MVRCSVIFARGRAGSAQAPFLFNIVFFFGEQEDALKGVSTKHLLILKQRQHGEVTLESADANHALQIRQNRNTGVQVPIFVRPSTFGLSHGPSIPIIIVGPGTGVAPLHGFISSPREQAKIGIKVGPTLLFYGCRSANEDFLYFQEWDVI